MVEPRFDAVYVAEGRVYVASNQAKFLINWEEGRIGRKVSSEQRVSKSPVCYLVNVELGTSHRDIGVGGP